MRLRTMKLTDGERVILGSLIVLVGAFAYFEAYPLLIIMLASAAGTLVRAWSRQAR
jgi:hypothetical protein